MKKSCRACVSVVLAMIIICLSVVPAFAADDGVSTYLTNCSDATFSFGVANGMASFYVSYTGKSSSFTRAKLTVQIQKKFLGLFWRDAADEWVGYNSQLVSEMYDDIPIDGTGTYRAVFKLEVFGSTGVIDVIEDTIEHRYS